MASSPAEAIACDEGGTGQGQRGVRTVEGEGEAPDTGDSVQAFVTPQPSHKGQRVSSDLIRKQPQCGLNVSPTKFICQDPNPSGIFLETSLREATTVRGGLGAGPCEGAEPTGGDSGRVI